MFTENTVRWLVQVEETLLQLHNPLVSLVAAGRGKILAASDGYTDPSVSIDRTGKRKRSLATIMVILSEIESAIRKRIDDIDAKLGAWQEKMVQFIAVATVNNSIPLPPDEQREAWLRTIWRSFQVSREMEGMYNYLNTVMAECDRLYILNEIVENLTRSDFPSNQPSADQTAKNRQAIENENMRI
jgi:hypothetical protein